MALTTDIGSRKARRKEQRRSKKKGSTKKRGRLDDDDEHQPAHDGQSQAILHSDTKKTKRRKKESSTTAHDDHDAYSHLDSNIAAAMRNDDAEIADLEAKLLLGNKKDRSRLHREYAKLEGYGDDFGDFLDGLDGLMDRVVGGHDEISAERDENSEKSSSSDEMVPMKEPFEHLDEDDSVLDELERKKTIDSDEEEDSPGSGEGQSDESEQEEPDHNAADTYRPSEGEDIYGNKALVGENDSAPKKYVPPHLRKQQGDDESRDERLRVLRRLTNNALNRLSEDTLISVAQSLSQLYSSYPTSDVNDTIWENVKNACVSPPIVMSGMIPVYVACLAGVHLQTGDTVQLGGYVLEHAVTALWKELKSSRETKDLSADDVSKDACNLVLVVCYLYNFGIVQCTVVYDIVRDLIKHFSELDVELLLLILSHCGFALRSDDPTALKEIVLAVQERALSGQKETEMSSSRVEFMISAMMDLKNNKKRKQDTVFADKTSKLRKLLGRVKSTVAADGKVRSADSCLRITLDDILHVESKGRWWKVGASWVGNQYKHKGDDEDSDEDHDEGNSNVAARSTAAAEEDEKLLKLASKYRMNSDTRRAIFCIVMGSTNCEDAFEKLVRAGLLKNRAERDTVRVLMECCGNEKSYNPFYSLLASRMCEHQPQCKFSFQLAFWDIFKQFDDLKARKVANLAKLLYHLVAKHQSLRLHVLKVIDMAPAEISENALIFLTVFFSTIFESFDDPAEVHQLVSNGLHSGRTKADTDEIFASDGGDDADSEGLRESLSIFFLQTLKSSPKNKKKSKFRANFKAAVKACESDGLDSMV